ncbi:MAG: phosphoglycerate dehydrogenase [Pirellulaceae bacterium]|nr:phosphoglycerate dehydrogenase [Pirellulaceae bacterium]
MPKILVLDPIAQEGIDLLEKADGIEYEVRTALSGETLRMALAQADGAICRSGVTITSESLKGNTRLKAIARAGVGTDNIDKTMATRQGIIVMNTPTGNTVSTAEHTFALLLALSRNVASANQSLEEGRWDRKKYIGTQVASKTLGIVGLGRIGQEVAKRAIAFDMQVVGYDPFLSSQRAEQLGIELCHDLSEIWPLIDYLTVHTPKTKETTDLINEEVLRKIKPGVKLINCARGGIYNETTILKGLESGAIGGIALDVYETEPCTDSALFGLPNVVCTPHLGASTEEAQIQVAVEAVNLLLHYFKTGEIRHAVNVAPIDPVQLNALRGYLNVAYRLGLLLAQWHTDNPSQCKLTIQGDLAKNDTRLISAAFSAGFLESAVENANIINAEILMKERGIQLVVHNQQDRGDFSSLITAKLITDNQQYVVSGTLFGNDMARLVRINEYRLETYLDGNLFLFWHHDLPGIIGTVGTTFGKYRVNIAHMSVGRFGDKAGGHSIGILNLDSLPPEEAMIELKNHPDLEKVSILQLPPPNFLPPWLS